MTQQEHPREITSNPNPTEQPLAEPSFNPNYVQQQSQIPAAVQTNLVQQQQPMMNGQPQVQTATNFNPVLFDQSQSAQNTVYSQSNGPNTSLPNQNHGGASVPLIPYSVSKAVNDAIHTPGASSVQLNGLVNNLGAPPPPSTAIPPPTTTNANMSQQNSQQQQQQMQSTSAPNIDMMQQQALFNSNTAPLASQGLPSGNLASSVSAATMVNSSYGSNLSGMMNSELADGQNYNASKSPPVANQAQTHHTNDQTTTSTTNASLQNPPAVAAFHQASPKETQTQSATNLNNQMSSASATAFDQTASSLKEIILKTGSSADNSDSM